MLTANEPAYPCEVDYQFKGEFRGVQTGNCTSGAIGLTKREHFAALAIQGVVSNPHFGSACDNEEIACILAAKLAVQFADALIVKLNESPARASG
jgi:hypothetical protein